MRGRGAGRTEAGAPAKAWAPAMPGRPTGRGLFVGLVEGHVVLVGVVAGGAYLRGFGADEGVAADEAAPCDGFFAFPDGAFLYLAEVAEEAAVVVQLDFGDCAEMGGDVGEAFLVGHVGELAVHFVAFLAFLACGDFEVGGGVGDGAGVNAHGHVEAASFEVLEVNFGVMKLIGGGFAENLPDGEIVFFVGLLRIEGIARVSHRLGGVGNHKILLGLSPFD